MTTLSCKDIVVRQSVSTVVPAHQVPPYNYFLSNLDLLFASQSMYVQGVYFFRTKQNDPETPSMQSLMDSLSKVLSIYPVLAGRLTLGKTGRFEVDVNGKGVPFVEATTKASLDDWPDLRACDLEEDLNPENPFGIDMFTAPLIRVQFTTFRCGGMALGFSSLHVVADGQAAIEFLKSWGEIHRGVQLSTPPQFESMKLRARNPPVVNISSADEFLSACVPVSWYHPSMVSLRSKNVNFRIERHTIEKIIKDVETGAFSYGSTSSYEALSALFWTAVTRARGLEDSALTTYIFPVSVRGRCDPPLPKGYFGNTIIMSQVTATAKDIKSNHFSFAASLIHKRVKMIEPGIVQSVLDWMELRLQHGQEIGLGFDVSTGSNMLTTSFANFPVYDIDFGRKLDHFEFTILDSSQRAHGLLKILPPPPGANRRSREVKLRLREDHLENLLRDPDFHQYFSQNAA